MNEDDILSLGFRRPMGEQGYGVMYVGDFRIGDQFISMMFTSINNTVKFFHYLDPENERIVFEGIINTKQELEDKMYELGIMKYIKV